MGGAETVFGALTRAPGAFQGLSWQAAGEAGAPLAT
jgi:hypothetical protein